MALYYFDTSVLVKYYIFELGSGWVRELVDARVPDGNMRANIIFISEACITESAAAFAILYRMQRISQRARDGAFRALLRHIDRSLLETVPVVTADFQLAAHLTQRHPLKAYDAVQLAVALRHNQALISRGSELTFVSGDNTLINAAGAEGFSTDNPFNHIAPEGVSSASRE